MDEYCREAKNGNVDMDSCDFSSKLRKFKEKASCETTSEYTLQQQTTERLYIQSGGID